MKYTKPQYAFYKAELIRRAATIAHLLADQNKKFEKKRYFKIDLINATLSSMVSWC